MGLSASVVLFDLDGTLTDSLPGIADSLRHTLAPLGLTVNDDAVRALIGPPLRDALREVGVTEDRLDESVDAYRAYFARDGLFNNRLYDGVAEMLRALVARGLTLGVATAKFTGYAERILEHFAIADCFTVVAGTTQDRVPLTKSQIVARALDELGAPDRTRTVLIGDTVFDVAAARANGLGAVGVTWGYGEGDELRRAGAAHLVATPAEVLTLLA